MAKTRTQYKINGDVVFGLLILGSLIGGAHISFWVDLGVAAGGALLAFAALNRWCRILDPAPFADDTFRQYRADGRLYGREGARRFFGAEHPGTVEFKKGGDGA